MRYITRRKFSVVVTSEVVVVEQSIVRLARVAQ